VSRSEVQRESRQHDAYAALIRPIEDEMLRAVWSVTRDADDAEEALQDALVTIWRRFDRVQRHPNPHALILRICMNAAYDALRVKIRRRRREADVDGLFGRTAATPAETLSLREWERAILDALARLSRNQATAFVLRVVHGESYEEVARVLGCRESTARKHVNRGRERLKALLAAHLEEA